MTVLSPTLCRCHCLSDVPKRTKLREGRSSVLVDGRGVDDPLFTLAMTWMRRTCESGAGRITNRRNKLLPWREVYAFRNRSVI